MKRDHRRWPRVGFTALLTVAVVLMMVVTAVATTIPPGESPGDFEIDGNLTSETAPDWASVLPDPPGEPGHDAVNIVDPHSKIKPNVDENWFAKGGKFDDPAGWTIEKATGPAQNELTNIGADFVLEAADENSWLMLGMERTKTSGTFDLDFEINQVAWDGTSGTLARTAGDLVVAFELKGNPTDAQSDLQEVVLVYDPDNTLIGNVCATTVAQGKIDTVGPGSEPCEWYGDTFYKIVFKNFANIEPDFDGDGNADLVATMNATDIPVPTKFTSWDSSGAERTTIPAFQFAEAALNLTALNLEPGCAGLGSVHAKSRSSLEPGSDLKDLAGPQFFSVTCGISGTKYNDAEADDAGAAIDADDVGLAGWTIKLYNDKGTIGVLDAADTLAGTTTTDSNGDFSFSSGLEFGDYLICEVDDSLGQGWTQSFPAPNTICAYDSSLAPAGYAVTIGLGTGEALLYTMQDFANYLLADIEVHKSGTISYTASVSNNGPAAATGVVLSDDLPGALSWSVSSQSDTGVTCDITGNALSCAVGELANGASFSVTVTATIAEDTTACTTALLFNQALASTTRPQSDTTNDSASASICALPTP